MRKITAGSPRTTDGSVGGGEGKLEIEHVDPHSLKHHPTNTRDHNQQNIDAIKTSYTTFGQRKPLVVWRGLVIAGNGALEAVLALGWKSVAITRCDHLTDSEARTYSIADNKTTDLSTFNYGKLAVELQELQSKEVDISATGFQNYEIEPLISSDFDPATLPEGDTTSGGKSIHLTPEQWETVNTALAKIREVEGEYDTKTDAAAIYVLCYRYLEEK